jgi:hypothetical protein
MIARLGVYEDLLQTYRRDDRLIRCEVILRLKTKIDWGKLP